MNRIIVHQVDGPQIGEITQSANGNIVVKGQTPAIQDELSAIVERLTTQPIPLRTSNERETSEGIVYETVVINCGPEHPKYLAAIADTLMLCEDQVGGKEIWVDFEEQSNSAHYHCE